MSTKTKLTVGIIVCATVVLIGMCNTNVIKTQWVCLIPPVIGILIGVIAVIKKVIKGNKERKHIEANPYARMKKFYFNDVFEHLN